LYECSKVKLALIGYYCRAACGSSTSNVNQYTGSHR